MTIRSTPGGGSSRDCGRPRPPPPEPAARSSWLARLRSGLSKTSAGLTGIFIGVKIDEALFEELETALLMSDAGVDATEYLLSELRLKIKSDRLTEGAQVKAALRTMLRPPSQPTRYCARSDAPSESAMSTPLSSCVKPVTSRWRRMATPSSSIQPDMIRSKWLCNNAIP